MSPIPTPRTIHCKVWIRLALPIDRDHDYRLGEVKCTEHVCIYIYTVGTFFCIPSFKLGRRFGQISQGSVEFWYLLLECTITRQW